MHNKSDDTKVPTVNGQNLPAQLDHDVDVLLQQTARSNPILRWKQENGYRIGEEERELGREYVAFPREWSRGPVKWIDGEIVEQRIKRVVDDPTLPSRESLGDNDKSQWEDEDKDPWSFMNYLPMEDVETGEFVLFSTASMGGRIAVEKLCNHAAREIKAGRRSGLPKISLATKPFPTKFGQRQRPDFPISGWVYQEPIHKDMDDEIPF
jgi:hypothetical protein